MFSDSRFYERVNRDINCVLYLEDNTEVEGIVKNISESGFYIELDYSDTLFNYLESGMILKVQGADDLNYIDIVKLEVFNEIFKITRVERKEDRLGVGCKVSERDISYSDYVTDIKVVEFLSNMRG